MTWLQSYEQFNELAELDHKTGEVAIQLREHFIEQLPATEGWFAILANTFVALYVFAQALFLRIGHMCIPLTADVQVKTSGCSTNRTLMVFKAGCIIARLNYLTDKFAPDTTPFIAAEDHDFGLLLENIAKDEKRQRVLLGLDC